MLVLEPHRQRLKHAGTFHVNALVAVDQDVVDGWILEQRLKRTKAGHFIEDFRNEIAQFLGVERQALDQHILRNELLDMAADFFFRDLVQGRKVDLLDQAPVQTHLGVEELVAKKRTFRLLSGGTLLVA